MNDYEKLANDFLEKTGTEFKATFLYHGPHFSDEKDSRDVYEIVLTRGDKKPFCSKFGQSINESNSKENREKILNNSKLSIAESRRQLKALKQGPNPYDVLACLTKSDPGTFSEFCAAYGFDTDSRKAERIYFDVQAEWTEVKRFFGDVLEELGEIN